MILDEETEFGEWMKQYRSEHGGRGPHCGDAWIAGRESIRNGIVALYQERDAAIARAEAAEQALRLATNSTPGKPTTVMMTLDKWTLHLADVERYGADQWRNGNAGREPQEFLEWRRQQP